MGNLFKASVTPVITAGAYSADDIVGTLLTLSNICTLSRGSFVVESILLSDQAKQDDQTDVIFFSENPSGSTFTDNGAATVVDADLDKIIGCVNIPAANYFDFADNSVAIVKDINLPIKKAKEWDAGTTPKGKDIYCVLVTRGTPTYATVSDLVLTVVVRKD